MDTTDRRILELLQANSELSLNEISDRVHLSRNACWNRIRQLETDGVIRKRVALLDPVKLNLGLSVFIAVKTNRHDADWLERFSRTTRAMPEIISIYRTTGDTDYLLHAVVPDMQAYDDLYKRIIAQIDLSDVSASFVMEEIKRTTELPLTYLQEGARR